MPCGHEALIAAYCVNSGCARICYTQAVLLSCGQFKIEAQAHLIFFLPRPKSAIIRSCSLGLRLGRTKFPLLFLRYGNKSLMNSIIRSTTKKFNERTHNIRKKKLTIFTVNDRNTGKRRRSHDCTTADNHFSRK